MLLVHVVVPELLAKGEIFAEWYQMLKVRILLKKESIVSEHSHLIVADHFVCLFDSITRNKSSVAHGREGIYVSNTIEFSYTEFSTIIGEVLVEHGEAQSSIPQPYTRKELENFMLPVPDAFITNSESVANTDLSTTSNHISQLLDATPVFGLSGQRNLVGSLIQQRNSFSKPYVPLWNNLKLHKHFET
jgi:hypothetical protein